MKKGFTLVELSIVLVIIGLLVGGILIGQSLIESAKIGAFVRQMQQIDAAANLFKDKYKSLPGDNDIVRAAIRSNGGGMVPVKRDGILCDDDCANNSFYINSEAHNFFYDLNVVGGVKYDNCKTLSSINYGNDMVISGPNCTVPTSKLGEKGMIFITYTNNNPSLNTNLYNIFDCTGMAGTGGWFNGANGGGTTGGCKLPFTGGQAYSYDNKVDDGIATTGNVVSSTTNYGNVTWQGYDGDQTIAGSQSGYNVSSKDLTHALTQKLGVKYP